MKEFEKDERFLRARERVQELRKFYTGVATYIFVVAVLAAVNYYSNGFSYPWFLWVAGFWGLGILFHAARIYGRNILFGKDWEERKIREFMNEDQRKSHDRGWE